MLEIRLLGQFELRLDGQPLSLRSRPAQTLLAYLVLHAGTPHRREKLAGLLWPDTAETSARNNLRYSLWQLRQTLGQPDGDPPFLLTDDLTVAFNAATPHWLDVSLLQNQGEGTTAELLAAAAVYRGELLPGVYDEWLTLEREQLRALYENRIQQLLDRLTHERRWPELRQWSERWLALGHIPEPAYRALMVAHAGLGDSSGIVATYQRCLEALDRELGVIPSPATRSLYERLLRDDLIPLPGLVGYDGQVIGPYRLVEKLGEGGMAEVFKAYQPSLDRYVALKFIRPELVSQPGFMARFEREARLLARLTHPHIVPIHDFGQVSPLEGTDSRTYLVMLYIAGGTLKSWLGELATQQERLPLEQIALILKQIAAALDHAHQQGIIHRDIKPANIILTPDRQALLSDFGMARLLIPSGDLTQPGVLTGTPDYMSPEQIRGQPDEIGPASDVYSLGVVLYEMITGRLPYVGDTPAAVIVGHLRDNTPPPRTLNPDCPPLVEGVILRTLAKDPTRRFATAGALAQAFSAAAEIATTAAADNWPVTSPDEPTPGSPPYQGLPHFDVADASRFFGRETLTARLVDHLAQSAFLAVVGASGSGKSSLVRAGLLPALAGVSTETEPVRQCFLLTPTAHPLESLAAALTHTSESVTATATLIDDLTRDPRSLHLFARRLCQDDPTRQIILVVDQFEELFTLCRDENERRAFVANLLTAVHPQTAGPTRLVIVLRADFYAACATYADLRLALEQGQAFIGPMSREELRRAILEPAHQDDWTLEAGLVEFMLQEVGDEPGGLPLLSHTLLETWRRRRGRVLTYSGYTQSGGVRGAIAQTAEQVYHHFSPEQQRLARHLFLRLTEPGELTADGASPDTRRRAHLNELIPPDESGEAVRTVLHRLADARLITLSQEGAEVAHEALIREWPTLRQWLDESREGLRLHRHLTESAQAWARLDRNPGELYRAARLAQASEWASDHLAELNLLEQEFLAAGQTLAQQHLAEREAQQQRELEAAQKLAHSEQQRATEQAQAAHRLQRRAYILAAAFGLAVFLAVVALVLGRQAVQNEQATAREARTALARELASAAANNLAIDPELGALLALQAITTTYRVDGTIIREAENALHQAIPALRLLLRFPSHAASVNDIALSPDGTRLVTVSNDNTGKVWAITPEGNGFHQQELFTLTGHTDWLWDVTYSPDGRFIATASRDGTARIWSAEDGQLLLTLADHEGEVFFVAFNADSTLLASGDSTSTYRIWRIAAETSELSTQHSALTPTPLYTFIETGGLGVISFSPDGDTMALSANEEAGGEIWVWSLAELAAQGETEITGHEGATVMCCQPELLLLEFSPDGQRLVSGSNDATAIIWNAAAGQPQLTLYGHTGPVNGADFSAAGNQVITSSGDGSAKVWDAPPTATGARLLLTLSGQIGSVIESFFLPDGQHILSASEGGTVTVWDGSVSRELLTITDHSDWVWSSQFSPDGRWLATAGFDLIVQVTDVDTGAVVFRTPEGAHTDWINRAVFSPDGERLATASNDGTVKVWEILSHRSKIS